jgi:hypothetical protein
MKRLTAGDIEIELNSELKLPRWVSHLWAVSVFTARQLQAERVNAIKKAPSAAVSARSIGSLFAPARYRAGRGSAMLTHFFAPHETANYGGHRHALAGTLFAPNMRSCPQIKRGWEFRDSRNQGVGATT